MKSPVLFFLLFPAFSLAQSSVSHYSSVVSVQELTMPRKATRALEKGTALLLKNDPQASISYFQTSIALAPDSFHAYHNLALAHYRVGDVEDAVREFQKSIELSKGFSAPPLFGLSMILYQRGEFLQADSLAQRGLVLAPSSAVGKYCLGLVQFALGQIPEAQRSALDAIRLDPAEADGDVYLLLARIHERLNDQKAVVADVRLYFKVTRKRTLQADAQTLLERAQQNLRQPSTGLEAQRAVDH
jgi:tetratricopeptide (TPR) repeat protein